MDLQQIRLRGKMKVKDCPLCEMEIVSDTGKGCMMCGMPIDYGDFCCMRCEDIWEMINKIEKNERRE